MAYYNTGSKRIKISEEICEDIFSLDQKGISPKDIAKYTGVSSATVYRVMSVYRSVVDDNFSGALEQVDWKRNSVQLEWALKKCGKKMPESFDEEPVKQTEVEKNTNPEKQDGTNEDLGFARIMVALGQVIENLENIGKWVTKIYEDQNANADNIHHDIQDAKGAIVQQIRKIPKTYRGE